MYNPNRLEWHLGDETVEMNPSVFCGGSCQATNEAFAAVSIALLSLMPRAKIHQSKLRGFSFGRPTDSRYVTGPAWAAKSENTDTAIHPAACRPALIERLVKDWVQRWKQGPFYKRINPSSALGFFVVLDELRRNEDEQKNGEGGSFHPWRTYA